MNVSRTCLAIAIALLLSAFSAMTLLGIEVPPPTGPHPIGTLDGLVEGGTPIKLWYPARLLPGALRAAYRPELEARQRTIRQRILFPLVRPAAYLDVPVAAGKHAVVFYVPGWGGRRSDNTALCEDLASHGFAVVAIDDQKPEPSMDFSSYASLETALRLANTKVRTQSVDVSNVLTALERVGRADPAYQVTSGMDFRRVAALGFSFGGATAAEAAVHDPRILAAVDLDGWTFGDAAQHGVDKPFLIVGDGAPTVDAPTKRISEPSRRSIYEMEFDRKNMQQMFAGFRRFGGYYVTIDGTRHENFEDAGWLSFGRRPAPGSIDGRRAARITAAYVCDFLGTVLDGRSARLLRHTSGALAGTSRSDLDRAAELTTWAPPSAALESTKDEKDGFQV